MLFTRLFIKIQSKFRLLREFNSFNENFWGHLLIIFVQITLRNNQCNIMFTLSFLVAPLANLSVLTFDFELLIPSFIYYVIDANN